MTCEEALELISAGLDGELTDEQAQLLTSHLQQCPDCRQLAEDLAHEQADILSLQQEPPDTLIPGVLREIHQERVKKQSRSRVWITAAVLASCAALLAVLSGFGLITLPGFGGNDRATASIGSAMSDKTQAILPSDLPSTEGLVAAYASETATETGRTVLVVWDCGADGLAELAGMDAQTLDDGAKLYEVSTELWQSVLDTYQKTYPMGVYYPDGPSSGETLAYIMIFE